MNHLPRGSKGDPFGGFLPGGDDLTPAPGRSGRPPKVWGTISLEAGEVFVRLSGWRAVVALRRSLSFPASGIVRVAHDPSVRANVPAKLRKRAGRTGVMRVGPYHSLEGWSFWSVGLARNAVVIETTGLRYRFVVVEVADPARTVDELRRAAGLTRGGGAPPGDPQPPPPWGVA